MTASYIPILLSEIPLTRRPLRLRTTEDPGRNRLNAAWWPQSRDLAMELADLGDHFPPGLGRIVRALLSSAEWDPAPRRIPVARGDVKVGSFPRDDTHLFHLTISDGTVLYVLVVPPGFTADQGEGGIAGRGHRRERALGSRPSPSGDRLANVDTRHHWTDHGEF